MTETDPTGRKPGDPGAKLDDGKVLVDDILKGMAHALWAVCELGTFGANKYSLNGCYDVPDGIRRYSNAEMRHKLTRWMEGDDAIDPDSKVLEATAEAWNALVKLELMLREKKANGK